MSLTKGDIYSGLTHITAQVEKEIHEYT